MRDLQHVGAQVDMCVDKRPLRLDLDVT